MVDHEDYLPGEAPAAHHESHEDGGDDEISLEDLEGIPAELADHAGDATAHQDAPALILTHKGDAAAHHAKYTDAEARALLSPITFHPSHFVEYSDAYDRIINLQFLMPRASVSTQIFLAGVNLPHGCTITRLTLWANRTDSDSILNLQLLRTSYDAVNSSIAYVEADWTTGNDIAYGDTISNPVVNNSDYSYFLWLVLKCAYAVTDAKFIGAKINFTG